MKIYPKKEPKRAPFSLTLIKRKSTSDAKRKGSKGVVFRDLLMLLYGLGPNIENLLLKYVF